MRKFIKMDMEKKKATIKYSWDFVDPPSSDCFCPTCGDILQEPMLTNCCGKHFCKSCIEPLFQTKQPCPNKECLETDYLCIVDKPKWKKIMELDVICPLKGRGCNWKGEVGTRDKHLDPQEGNCEYIDVECTNGCGEEMELYELAEHLERFCHKRPYTCEHCGFENVFEVVTKDHVHECPAFPIECPCNSDNITRSSYPEHLLACPEQVVECEFSYAGCQKRVLRKKMAQHQQDDVYTHLSLQTAFASKQLVERDKQLREVSEYWETKFNEMSMKMSKLQKHVEEQSKWMKRELQRKEVLISELRGIHKLEVFCDISSHRKLELKRGDIAMENADIIVNAGAEHFGYVMGVSKALNEASDGLLKQYTTRYLEEHPGENVCAAPFLTEAGGALDCKKVLHAFGPGWVRDSDAGAQSVLCQCIKEVLECAEKEEATSIAIPAISAGGLRGNKKLVAKCIFNSIVQHKYTKSFPVLADIRIVILDKLTFNAFAEHFEV